MNRSRSILAFALGSCLFCAPGMAFGQRSIEGNGPKPWSSGKSPFASHTPNSTFSQSHFSKKPEKAVSNRDSQPKRSQSNGNGQNNANDSRRAEKPRGGKESDLMKQKLDRNDDGRFASRELEHAQHAKENASKRKEGQANPSGQPPRASSKNASNEPDGFRHPGHAGNDGNGRPRPSGQGGRPKQTATKKAPKGGRGA